MTDLRNSQPAQTAPGQAGAGMRAEDARAGNPVGRMRRVLGISIMLVIAGFVLAYLLIR
jgi:hypothetical protein